jgi:hypothetical protein
LVSDLGPGPGSGTGPGSGLDQYPNFQVNHIQVSPAYNNLLASDAHNSKEKTAKPAQKGLGLQTAKLKTPTSTDSIAGAPLKAPTVEHDTKVIPIRPAVKHTPNHPKTPQVLPYTTKSKGLKAKTLGTSPTPQLKPSSLAEPPPPPPKKPNVPATKTISHDKKLGTVDKTKHGAVTKAKL